MVRFAPHNESVAPVTGQHSSASISPRSMTLRVSKLTVSELLLLQFSVCSVMHSPSHQEHQTDRTSIEPRGDIQSHIQQATTHDQSLVNRWEPPATRKRSKLLHELSYQSNNPSASHRSTKRSIICGRGTDCGSLPPPPLPGKSCSITSSTSIVRALALYRSHTNQARKDMGTSKDTSPHFRREIASKRRSCRAISVAHGPRAYEDPGLAYGTAGRRYEEGGQQSDIDPTSNT